MPKQFDVQGHRGCRGLRPESSLPGFENALDLGVTTLECDLHLTRDGVPVIWHDPMVGPRFARHRSGEPLTKPVAIAQATWDELRQLVVDGNPDPGLWSEQRAEPGTATPLWVQTHDPLPAVSADPKARLRADAYRLARLGDLLSFVAAYAGELGKQAGKSDAQRQRASRVIYNVETKRNPNNPAAIGDAFDGTEPGAFEKAILKAVQEAKVLDRFVLQSFDHRSLRAAKKLEPKLRLSALYGNTIPARVVGELKDLSAEFFSPNYQRLSERQVKEAQAAGVKVVPYTANDPLAMQRLIDWEVDGIITDYPNRLIPLVQARHWEF